MSDSPKGPIIATVAILAMGALYAWFGPSTQQGRSPQLFDTPTRGTIRVVTWNINPADRDDRSPAWTASYVADVLARLDPTVVLLQGVADRQFADAVAGAIRDGWTVEAVRTHGEGGHYAAVLVKQSDRTAHRHLIQLSETRRAVAFDLVNRAGSITRFVSTDLADADAGTTDQCLRALLAWLELRPAAFVVVGAVAPNTAAHPAPYSGVAEWAKRFVPCEAPMDASPGSIRKPARIHVSREAVSVDRVAAVTSGLHATDGEWPLIVDLSPRF